MVLDVNFVSEVRRPTVSSLQRDELSLLFVVVASTSELTAVYCGNYCDFASRIERRQHFSLSTWDKAVSVLRELVTMVHVAAQQR